MGEEMPSKMSGGAVHHSIERNLEKILNVYSDYVQKQSIDSNSERSGSGSDGDGDDEVEQSIQEIVNNGKERILNINLKGNTSMFETEYRSVQHRKKAIDKEFLKIGWTEVFFDFVFKATKLQCIWKFNHHVTTTIHITGECQCGATLNAEVLGENVHLHIKNLDDKYVHKGSRKLKGPAKQKALEYMKTDTPFIARLKTIDESVSDSAIDPIPPNITALDNYRQLKYTESLKQLCDRDVMKSLGNMKSNLPDFIYDIGYSPFFVFGFFNKKPQI